MMRDYNYLVNTEANIQIQISEIYVWNKKRENLTKTRKQLNLKVKDNHWLIGNKSKLSLDNKVLVYKTIIKAVWTYKIEIWGCVSKSNIFII